MKSNKNEVAKLLSIKNINVEKLFGLYNYKVEVVDPRLLILYGDNGSGKTTLLRIIFYILSIKDGSGFKSEISKIKFKKICFTLENGLEIGVFREDMKSNSFNYYLMKDEVLIRSVLLKSTNLYSIVISDQSQKEQSDYRFILNYLREINIHTFYLTDDRTIYSSINSSLNDDEDSSNTLKLREIEVLKRQRNRNSKLSLKPAIEKLENWIQNRVITGSLTGEKNSQVIFSDLINNFLTVAESTNKITKSDIEILKELDVIESKIPAYVKLGLIENFETKSIRNTIKKAKGVDHEKYLSALITPFLEGINAKLKALETVEQTVSKLINIINEYFSHKNLTYTLKTGFELKENNNTIDFDWLSSGEKQLILLLINTISSSDEATIFIIDEPEISLNIKWQRKLIHTLLEFSNDNNIQFIIATHSLELLSSNRKNVSKLQDLS